MFKKGGGGSLFLFDILGNDGILSNIKFIINFLIFCYEENY